MVDQNQRSGLAVPEAVVIAHGWLISILAAGMVSVPAVRLDAWSVVYRPASEPSVSLIPKAAVVLVSMVCNVLSGWCDQRLMPVTALIVTDHVGGVLV